MNALDVSFQKTGSGGKDLFQLFERTFVLLSTVEVTLLQKLGTLDVNRISWPFFYFVLEAYSRIS